MQNNIQIIISNISSQAHALHKSFLNGIFVTIINLQMQRLSLILSFLLIGAYLASGQIAVSGEQIPLDSTFNTIYDEINVVLSTDDNYLYFTRASDPQNVGGKSDKGDIWMSELNVQGEWTTPVNVSALNDEYENQVVGFLDPRTLLTRNKKQFMTHYLYNGKWWEPKKFDIPYFKASSDHISACVSHDGKYILFGMESFGTYGVEDIYVSEKGSDGVWTSPKNLGSVINTGFQEITPFLAPDDKTLLFASNGHKGEGSFDIFMSTRQDDTWQQWSKPVNLGRVVNTIGRESSFVFSLEEEYAYMVSTQNSEGYGDIKKVKITPTIIKNEKVEEEEEIDDGETKTLLTGKVISNKTQEGIIGAEIKLESLEGLKRYKASANSVGNFVVNVADTFSYTLKVSALHYMSYEEEVRRDNLYTIKDKTFVLHKVEEGATVSLDHVLFERGTSELVPGSEKELNLVVEMMKLNPEVTIFLAGHTDNQGSSSANLTLSQDRVETVKKYLSKHGVRKKRITGQGFGGTKPRASNANIESRKLNRRVEFTIHIEKKD